MNTAIIILVEHPSYYSLKGFNKNQNSLYRRALFGLKGLTFEEVQKMCTSKKKRIKRVNLRALAILNELKQEKLIKVSYFLLTRFIEKEHRHKLLVKSQTNISYLVHAYSEPDPEFQCKMTCLDLDISIFEILDRFIETGILPYDFYYLRECKNTVVQTATR